MQEIFVPNLTANEEVLVVTKVLIEPGAFCQEGDELCVLESTKVALPLESEFTGYVVLLADEGELVKVGDLIGYQSKTEIDLSQIKTTRTKHEEAGLVVTKKAEMLVEKYGLNPTDIASEGVLTTAMIRTYLQSTDRTDDVSMPTVKEYDSLERIAKQWESEPVADDDILSLKRILTNISNTYAARWNRRIPVLDVLFDRWATAEQYGFSEGANVSHLSYIIGDVKVGRETFIGPFTMLDGSGGLEIGDYCSIAAGVQIYSHDSVARALSRRRSAAVTRLPTKIGDSCFIGPNSVITRGVTIGSHCVVAANSVLLQDVPDYTVVQGNPAKVIAKVVLTKGQRVRIEPVNGD